MTNTNTSNFQETIYLMSIPGMTESILKSREEATEDCQPFDPSEDWSNTRSS